MRRDNDILNGRCDLFAKANSSRSEASLGLDSRSKTPWGPKIWRTVAFHDRPIVGERVRIRSLVEILRTLDALGCVDGLPFMSEMEKYCGQSARVFRSVDKIYDYGGAKNLRRLTNAVLLTGLRCDGEHHGGCQAGCYLIWKTDWLVRLDALSSKIGSLSADSGARQTHHPLANGSPLEAAAIALAKTDARGRYTCQFTKLVGATSPMSASDLRQDLRALVEGNVAPLAFTVALLTRLFNWVQRQRGGADYPLLPKGSARGQPQPARQVLPNGVARVRSRESIAATLDNGGRNRGLWFDLEMLKHCGQKKRVSMRVERIIDDASGKMLHMKTPCLVLDGVQASGEFLRFCPQEESIYWREAWLIPDDDSRETSKN